MADREKKEIVTPAGHRLVVKTYLTGREVRDLQVPYLKTSEEFPKALIDEKGLRAASFQAIQDLTLRTIIVSFDGKLDGQNGFDVVATILDDLPASEYSFIIRKLNEIVADPDGDEQKKTN